MTRRERVKAFLVAALSTLSAGLGVGVALAMSVGSQLEVLRSPLDVELYGPSLATVGKSLRVGDPPACSERTARRLVTWSVVGGILVAVAWGSYLWF